MNLGEHIYKLRTQKNLSQGDLADALEVSRQSVSKWENNSAVPELEKLVKMAQLFGVSLDELVNGTSAEAPHSTFSSQPTSSVTTNELISIVLLILGIILPLVFVYIGSESNNSFLIVLGLFFIPPLVTLGAAYCTPKNKTLFYVYAGYNILFCLLCMITVLPLAILTSLLNLGAFFFWNDRRNNEASQ